jgi:hypothetical protein
LGSTPDSKDSRIILVLDGLENFRDCVNDQGLDSEQSADWVPWYVFSSPFLLLLLFRSFPERFRVIILTRKRSKAMNHFKLRRCPLLYMGEDAFFGHP